MILLRVYVSRRKKACIPLVDLSVRVATLAKQNGLALTGNYRKFSSTFFCQALPSCVEKDALRCKINLILDTTAASEPRYWWEILSLGPPYPA